MGRVMGFDPGTQNFAWCIDGPDGLEDHDVEEGIRKDVKALGAFAERIWRVLKRFEPEAVVIERYHPRGGVAGASAGSFVHHTERVNLMIGVVWTQCVMLGILCTLTTASAHKVWAAKNVGATKKGEVCVWASEFEVHAKSLVPPPEKFHGLTDTELRYRQRYIDMYANPETMRTLAKRSELVSAMRRFMDDRAYLEVETPMMQSLAGGAAARPFRVSVPLSASCPWAPGSG